MASGGLQDSNRDNACDFIGESAVTQSCEPCMKTNFPKTATVFCKDCLEFLCDTCINPHNVYKPGNHDIVILQNNTSAAVLIDMKGMDKCREHGRDIEFFCQDHYKLCCISCVKNHRKCDKLDEITEIAVQKRPELPALRQSLTKLQSEADAIIAKCKQSETSLNETVSIAKISSEVDKMRKRIIQLFEEAKQKLINEAKQFIIAEVKHIGNKRVATSKFKEELNNALSMCCDVLDHGTPRQQFIYSEQMKEKHKTMESTIDDQKKITFASKVTVSFTKELTSLIKMGINFVKVKYDVKKTVETSPISLSSRPVTLKRLVSVKLHKTQDDEEEPRLSGLDFLPDGRLVAVDHNNMKCIILNERLQRLGTPYKFTNSPYCVVCVSRDTLCVTFCDVVCLLSVIQDNSIRMTKEISTSSNFYSICCMSPSQMVVSTWDDPRPARMLSVDGVQSDFDHFLTFPMKTYKLGESMCTYVKSKNTLVLTDNVAHKVYLYDTVKGTSTAVTNENIQEPYGCCVGPGDTVLVCSLNNHSIVHLSADGDIIGTYPVDMKYPSNICVSKDGTRMAVSNYAKGVKKLQMYTISPVMS